MGTIDRIGGAAFGILYVFVWFSFPFLLSRVALAFGRGWGLGRDGVRKTWRCCQIRMEMEVASCQAMIGDVYDLVAPARGLAVYVVVGRERAVYVIGSGGRLGSWMLKGS